MRQRRQGGAPSVGRYVVGIDCAGCDVVGKSTDNVDLAVIVGVAVIENSNWNRCATRPRIRGNVVDAVEISAIGTAEAAHHVDVAVAAVFSVEQVVGPGRHRCKWAPTVGRRIVAVDLSMHGSAGERVTAEGIGKSAVGRDRYPICAERIIGLEDPRTIRARRARGRWGWGWYGRCAEVSRECKFDIRLRFRRLETDRDDLSIRLKNASSAPRIEVAKRSAHLPADAKTRVERAVRIASRQ